METPGKKMDLILNIFTRIFDPIRQFWEKETTHKTVSGMLVLTFLFALVTIELNRQGLLPDSLETTIPKSHYLAINLAFTLVLILEVLGMIFTLPASLSRALGKQFEILALIFLRNAFKELAVLPEPISLSQHHEVLWHILSYGFGGVAIFALLGIYAGMLERLDETLAPGPSLTRFIARKKAVALVILIIFCGMGLYNGQLFLARKPVFHFFQYFYTILIFSDILLVLIAQSFLPEFPAVFRNSGYALATLLIRISLTAPAYYNVLIGLSSVVLAVLLTLVYNQFYTHKKPMTKR